MNDTNAGFSPKPHENQTTDTITQARQVVAAIGSQLYRLINWPHLAQLESGGAQTLTGLPVSLEEPRSKPGVWSPDAEEV